MVRVCVFCGEPADVKVTLAGDYYVCRQHVSYYKLARTLVQILRQNDYHATMPELLKFFSIDPFEKQNIREVSKHSRMIYAVVRVFRNVFTFSGSEIRLRERFYRYLDYRYCWLCKTWVSRKYSFCPRCGNKELRSTPRMHVLRKKYNSAPRYSLQDAMDMYYRFLGRGYTVDEAVEAVEAITGFKLEPSKVEELVAVEV